MSDVQLSEIDKSYGHRCVLDRLNLSVRDGEYLVILGPSGSGKTTILRLIAGLERPDAGQIKIGGRNVSRVPPRRRDVSMVFQGDALYPHLTVEQSLAVGLRRKLAAADWTERLESATRLAGIKDLLGRRPDRLSGGERRRAALAKAIVRRSAVRLLDEPLAALDAPVRHGIQQAIRRWHESTPGTTIHVTHDGQEAMRMADRIAVVGAGGIEQCATPDELYAAPVSRSVALALGSPPICFLAGSVNAGQLRLHSSAFQPSQDLVVAGDTGEIEVGIRSQACQIATESARTDSGIVMTGKLLRMESVDGRKLATIAVADLNLQAAFSGDLVDIGQEVTLFVPATQLHVFDCATGRRRDLGVVS